MERFWTTGGAMIHGGLSGTKASTQTNTQERELHTQQLLPKAPRASRASGGGRAPRVRDLAERLAHRHDNACRTCNPSSDRDDWLYFKISGIATRPLPGPEAARPAKHAPTFDLARRGRRCRVNGVLDLLHRDVISEYAISIFWLVGVLEVVAAMAWSAHHLSCRIIRRLRAQQDNGLVAGVTSP